MRLNGLRDGLVQIGAHLANVDGKTRPGKGVNLPLRDAELGAWYRNEVCPEGF